MGRVFIHELMHVMGFSGYFFQRLGLSGRVQVGRITRTAITHPHVVEYAKEYFGCDQIQGIPIEDGGSSGSAGSHFEKTMFPAEIMNPSVMAPARISEFTIRTFEAMGWYQGINAHQEYTYLKGDGCHTIVGGECNGDKSEEFCSAEDRGHDHCYGNRMGKAHCGNFSMFTGNCRYIAPTNQAWCTVEDSSNRKNFSFESYGPHSRCFMTEKSSNNMDAACLRTRCTKTAVEIQIGSEVFTCPGSGPQQVNLSAFKGKIDCPVFSEMCEVIMEERCPMDCYGQGMCMAGNTCQCQHGFTGADCNKGLPKEEDPFVTGFDWRNRNGEEKSAEESASEPAEPSGKEPEKSVSETDADDDEDEEDREASEREDEEEEKEEEDGNDKPLCEEAKKWMAQIEKLQASEDYWKKSVHRKTHALEKYTICLANGNTKRHKWCEKGTTKATASLEKAKKHSAEKLSKIEELKVKIQGKVTTRQWDDYRHEQEVHDMMRASQIEADMMIWYSTHLAKYNKWKLKWEGYVKKFEDKIAQFEQNDAEWAKKLVEKFKAKLVKYVQNVEYYTQLIKMTEEKLTALGDNATGKVEPLPESVVEDMINEGLHTSAQVNRQGEEEEETNGLEVTGEYKNN